MSDGSGWDVEDHPLSASTIKTFDGCPLEFKLKYVDRKQPLGQEPYYLDIGNAVHYTIEEVLSKELESEGSVNYDDLKSMFLLHYPDVIGGTFRHVEPDPRQDFPIELDDEQEEIVVGCLDTAAKWLGKEEPTIRGVEHEVDFRINRADMDAPFTGYMDLTTEGSDANWVVDWKTGKSEGKEMDEALQGAVYMAGFYNRYGVEPDAIQFVYLKEGTVRSIEPDDKLWDTLIEKALLLLQAAETGEFQAQPSESNCHWCDYELHCPASPVGAGAVDWEQYP